MSSRFYVVKKIVALLPLFQLAFDWLAPLARRLPTAASGATVASIGEKWYYFGATSALGHSGPRGLWPSCPRGVRLAPRYTTLQQMLGISFVLSSPFPGR